MLICKATRKKEYGADLVVYKIDNPENAAFQIKGTKVHVPVVTLSTKNNKKLLEQLKSGFKRIAEWNKYRSQMSIQSKT